MSVIAGVLLHALGASAASICYAPQKKTRAWSWQTYWLAQATICWLLLPIVVAWITIPQLDVVLSKSPTGAMWTTFLLGAAYGIGGTAFGLAIKYVGFSLTYAIAVGISCVLGTLLPPLIHGNIDEILNLSGSRWIVVGVLMGVFGISLCGAAGRSKEVDLAISLNKREVFSLSRGLPLCILAGMLSAIYGFSLDQGQPIADVAFQHGAGNLQGNVIFLFSNSGAFLTTAIYCIYLHRKNKTFHEYRYLSPNPHPSSLRMNFLMAILTGFLWFSQFFFYGLGHVRMGDFKFSSWAIHMILLVLFSTVIGLMMKEWASSGPITTVLLFLALGSLIAAVLMISYGNYLAGS